MNRSILRTGLLVLALLAMPDLAAYAEGGTPSLTLGAISEKKPGHEIRMLFPKLAWPARPQVARAFNKASRAPVDAALVEFRQEMVQSPEQRPEYTWDLRSVWETRHKGTDLVSGVLTFGSYTGGAHPNPWLVSLELRSAPRAGRWSWPRSSIREVPGRPVSAPRVCGNSKLVTCPTPSPVPARTRGTSWSGRWLPRG